MPSTIILYIYIWSIAYMFNYCYLSSWAIWSIEY